MCLSHEQFHKIKTFILDTHLQRFRAEVQLAEVKSPAWSSQNEMLVIFSNNTCTE